MPFPHLKLRWALAGTPSALLVVAALAHTPAHALTVDETDDAASSLSEPAVRIAPLAPLPDGDDPSADAPLTDELDPNGADAAKPDVPEVDFSDPTSVIEGGSSASEPEGEAIEPAGDAASDQSVAEPTGDEPIADRPIVSEQGASEPAAEATSSEGATPSEGDGPDAAVPADPQDGAEPSEAVVPQSDLSALPAPVARMRELLLRAALRGDVEAVARLAGIGSEMTQLSLVQEDEDAATLLRQQSGDAEGFEVLAILSEILEAPYVVLDEGTDDALYLWPWFAGVPLDGLSAEQKVQAYRLMTAGDFAQSEEFGTYVFFRAGISADGRWEFFVAGD